MTLRLTDEEADALRLRAQREGRSMQEVARAAVRDYVERTSTRELLDEVLDDLGVAFHLTHKVLVGLVNTQRLRIAAGRVTFSNGPIPAGRKFDVAFDEIDGFAIAQRTSSTRNGTTVTLVLAANLAGGSERQLALTLEDRAAAEFAARRFNEVLADAKARALPVPYRS